MTREGSFGREQKVRMNGLLHLEALWKEGLGLYFEA